uniref:MotE family protein n=1 Tax=Yoonia sp. TaxID=2212373 RepID=UPI0040486827
MTREFRRKRGPLHVIAVLLVLSAVMRTTVGVGEAFAKSPDQTEPHEPAPEPNAVETPTSDILTALKAREERLAAREAIFADRVQALNVAEGEVAEQIAALRQAEEALSATLALADTAAQSDLGRLTTVYENMAPKDASALFEQMPPQFAAGFLGMMDPVAAAKVMAGLTPETAYSFSVVLAGRNALVPTR